MKNDMHEFYVVAYDYELNRTENSNVVSINTAPILSADSISILQGTEFNSLDGLNAVDGDITSLIKVDTENVDINKSGVYETTYSITNSKGYTTTETRKVIVYKALEYLSDRKWTSSYTEYGTVNNDKSSSGKPLKLNVHGKEKVFEKGIGTHAHSEIVYDVSDLGIAYFDSYVGVDRNFNGDLNMPSIKFEFYGDDVKLYETGILGFHDKAEHVSIDLNGIKTFKIIVSNAGNGNGGDHADLGDAKFLVFDSKPIIEIPNISWVELGNAFNPLEGVRAIDKEDGDLTNQIEVVGEVDTNKEGVYTLNYIVKDSDGNVTEVINNITVLNTTNSMYTSYLSDLPYKEVSIGQGKLGIDRNGLWLGIRLTGANDKEVTYKKGIGMFATSEITYDLTNLNASSFNAYVGIDRSNYYSGALAGFEVLLDGKKVHDTGAKRGMDSQTYVEVDVRGAKTITLRVNDGGNGNQWDNGIWANAQIVRVNLAMKEELRSLIETANNIDKDIYTQDSLDELQNAVNVSNTILTDVNSTQNQINSAVESLNKALNTLELIDKLNRVEIKRILDLADQKNQEDYETEVWEEFLEMREMAREVYYDKNATQEDVNSMAMFLEIELKNLDNAQIKVDKSILQAVIDKADSLIVEDYSPETWGILQSELRIAKKVMVSEGSSIDQAHVDSIVVRLENAIDRLKSKDI